MSMLTSVQAVGFLYFTKHFFLIKVLWYCEKGSKNGKKSAGKIEYRLERLRLKLSPSKKKNVMSSRIKTLTVNPEIQDLVKELRDLNPNKNNFNKIVVLFQQTFDDRCAMRRKQLSGAEIIKKYPKFMDYSGRFVSKTSTFV